MSLEKKKKKRKNIKKYFTSVKANNVFTIKRVFAVFDKAHVHHIRSYSSTEISSSYK